MRRTYATSSAGHGGSLYSLLNLQPTNSFHEVKAAFQQRAKECHPDMAASRGRNSKALETEFVTLQSAWEEYLASLKAAQTGAPGSVSKAEAQHLEMVLLILRMSTSSLSRGLLDDSNSHRIRNAVVDAVRQNGQKTFGKAFPPASVRRVQLEETSGGSSGVHVHIHAMNVKHRDSVISLISTKPTAAGREPPCDAFLRSLRASFVDYGGCADAVEGLSLAAGYTMQPVPLPTASSGSEAPAASS